MIVTRASELVIIRKWGVQTPPTTLIYIQPFKFAPGTNGLTDSGTNMYRYVRALRGNKARAGQIFPLTHLYLPVEVVPVFGERCSPDWTCDSAIESAKEFRLNCFDTLLNYMLVY